MNASQAWEQAIAEKMSAGFTKAQAVDALAGTEVHTAWLASLQSNPATEERPMPCAANPFGLDEATAPEGASLFNKAVSEAMQTGLSRGKAVAHVAQTRPALHERYLQEANR